ncbi:Beta-D-xylosidase 1, partial [Mucuna pruriens]
GREARGPFACDPKNVTIKSLPFCKVWLPIVARVNDLIRRLTLQEKVLQGVLIVGPESSLVANPLPPLAFPSHHYRCFFQRIFVESNRTGCLRRSKSNVQWGNGWADILEPK